MRKRHFLLFTLLIVTTLSATVPTRYFVGRTEVSEAFWNQMPDSLDYVTSEFNSDTSVVKGRELPYTHYLDSISSPGVYLLRKRSQEDISMFERALAQANIIRREKSLSKTNGDPAPQICLTKLADGKTTENFIESGNCYLLSFWATWCGNCLHELLPEFIPSVVEQFSDNTKFHFVPICIDASCDDLEKFFNSELGQRWSYLAAITYIDIDRKANSQYGESGIMPLNVVIGSDGNIRYIHSGALKSADQLSALAEAIKSGL